MAAPARGGRAFLARTLTFRAAAFARSLDADTLYVGVRNPQRKVAVYAGSALYSPTRWALHGWRA